MSGALRGRRGAALALMGILALCYSASINLRASRGATITGDEPFYLMTTQSLLQDADLDLRQQYDSFAYRAYFDHNEPLWRQSRPLPDGRLLSPHGLGLSVYLLPGFALGGLLGAQVQMLLTTAGCFALTFLLVTRVTEYPRLAWASTLAVALTPTAFVYATEVYPEAVAALCIVAALLIQAGERRSLGGVIGTVALVSALAWLGPKYVPLGAVISLALLWRATPGQRTVFVALSGISGAVFVVWHLAMYGALTPYSVNFIYYGASTAAVTGQHLAFVGRAYRLVGLFVDQQFGVGRWAPVLLLAAAAMPLLWHRGRTGRLTVALFGVQLLMATFVAITMRGWWFPGRTLLAVLPLLAWAITEACIIGGRRMTVTAGLLGAYSALLTIVLARAALAREVHIAVDPFALEAWLFRAPSALFPNYEAWTPHTLVAHLCWIVAWGAVAGWLMVAAREDGAWRGRVSVPLGRRASVMEG